MTSELAEAVRRGDRRALARAITLVESTRRDHRAEAEELLEELVARTGGSLRVGISGPPGAGKSTFIEALGLHILESGSGPLAVLAVDPSSARTGGSILGDKTRMAELARHPEAFIRPSPGAGHLGGVTRRTREAVLLAEAAGNEVVLVETIGVGQSETAVASVVDVFVLVTSPGAGDDLQGIKRGIMELADVVVVNKADGELAAAAARSAGDMRAALGLMAPRWASWNTPVLTCSAVAGTGIEGVWQAIGSCREALEASGELETHRASQAKRWMWDEVEEGLLDDLRSDPEVRQVLAQLEAGVASGEVSPTRAARELLARWRPT